MAVYFERESGMIKKLQHQFILYSTLAIIILMVLLLIPVNLFNYLNRSSDIHDELQYIADNGGELPSITLNEYKDYLKKNDPDYHDYDASPDVSSESGTVSGSSSSTSGETGITININSILYRLREYFRALKIGPDSTKTEYLELTPESSYQIRYFSAIFDAEGHILTMKNDHISSLTEEETRSFAESCYASGQNSGMIHYNQMIYSYYGQPAEDGTYILVFMDSTNDYRSFQMFSRYSIIFAIFCTIVFLIIITFISRKVVQPIARNIESQKQFITNAGHELKTPLTVISANAEVLEMINGKNEWTTSIRNQVSRLTGLVNNLITLTRMQETSFKHPEDMNLSAVSRQSAENFRPVIEQQGKRLETVIDDELHFTGDQSALSELFNILLDNAAKYCDEGGTVFLTLHPRNHGKGIHLTVTNTYADGEGTDYTRFFDRFYREDTSHNSKKSGYGIGLSMAKQIVENHHGKIFISYKKPDISFHVTL